MRWWAATFFLLIRVTCASLLEASTRQAPPPDSASTLLRRAVELARDGRAASQRAALELVFQAAEQARGGRNPTLEGLALVNAAQLYNNLGRPDSARPLARQGLDRLRGRSAAAPQPVTLVVLGETMQYLGQPDSALVYYRRALSAVRGTGTRDEARGLGDIGSAYHQLGVLDSAGSYLALARVLRERLQDTIGLATTLNNLGRLQQTLGRPDSAAVLFAAAIPLRRAAGDWAGLGATLNNLGYSFDLQGRPADALSRYRQALDALDSAGNLSTAGLVRINMGRAYLALGRLDSALTNVDTGLATKRTVGDSTGVTWGLVDLGRIERARGDRAAARKALEDARALLRAIGDRGREGAALYELGSLARMPEPGQSLREAVARFDTAATLRAAVGASARVDPDRVSFAEQDVALFEDWVLAWLDRRDLPPEQAALASLAATERGRARALLDLMRQRQTSGRAGADLVREGADLVQALRRGNPGATLVYLVGRDTLVVWSIPAAGPVTARRLVAGRAAVADAVKAFRVTLGVETGCEVTPETGVSRSAATQRLSSLLIDQSDWSRLRDAGELLVVPHGSLNLVPFAALLPRPGELLGERLAVRYAPSLTTAIQTASRTNQASTSAKERRASLSPALVVANPAMPLLPLCGVLVRPRALPGAEASSRWLASELGTDALVADRATERSLRTRIGTARLVHLETHGFAYESEARARDSFLALARDAGATPPPDGDGVLTVAEILDQLPPLQAELVVLGACQTGLGNLKDAEGTIGLQRAFLARGARTTLVSLWDIDDRASAALLREFYQQWLTGGVGKAEALRRAQDRVRHTPGFEDPRFWAAFVLAGGD